MTRRGPVIRSHVSAEEAIGLLASLVRTAEFRVDRTVYYPYYYFACQCSAPGLLLRRNLNLHCLVDAVLGQGATADAFETESCDLAAADVITATVAPRQAKASAERVVTHMLGKKLRTIANFQLELCDHVLLYKRFWVASNQRDTVLVDSVNGGIHPLRSCAA